MILEELFFKTRKNLFGYFNGRVDSIFKGEGVDFFEVKEYESGDDIRHLNAKVSAKYGEPFINLYTQEKEIEIFFIYLLSGSMLFDKKNKQARNILFALNYLAKQFGNSTSTIIFNTKPCFIQAPSKNINDIYLLQEELKKINPIGSKIDYSALNQFIQSYFSKPAILIMLGDFLNYEDIFDFGVFHELYLIWLRSKKEENLNLSGTQSLLDLNSFKTATLTITKRVQKSYQKLLQKQDTALKESCYKYNIAFTKIYSDEDFFPKLKELF